MDQSRTFCFLFMAAVLCLFRATQSLPLGAIADRRAPKSGVVIPPLTSSVGFEKLLVLLPESVKPEEYSELAVRVQRETVSYMSLWVAIPFVPYNATSEDALLAISYAISDAVSNGFQGSNRDTFLACHGQVGFQTTRGLFGSSPTFNYQGLVFWGSYPPQDAYNITSKLANTLTIGGEIDGNIRITRIEKEFRKFEGLYSKEGDKAISQAPVIVLPINHSAYTSTLDMEGDIASDLSREEQQRLVAQMTGAFLVIHSGSYPTPTDALIILKQGISRTEEFFSGYKKATEADVGFWCEHSEYMIAQLESSDLDKFSITSFYYTERTPFEQSKSSINLTVTPPLITLHNYDSFKSNPRDDPLVKVAPIEKFCKTLSQEWILLKLNLTSSKPEGDCATVNQAVLRVALDHYVSRVSRARFNLSGKKLVTLPDIYRGSGPEWLDEPLVFEQSSSNPQEYVAISPYLPTAVDSPFAPGVRYCKLISAAQITEWILFDSLKN